MKKLIPVVLLFTLVFATEQRKIEDDVVIRGAQSATTDDIFSEPNPIFSQMTEARKSGNTALYNELYEQYHTQQTFQTSEGATGIHVKPENDPIMRWGNDVIIYGGEVNYNEWAMLVNVDDEAISVDYHRGDTLRAAVACVDSAVRVLQSNDRGMTWFGIDTWTPGGAIYEPEIITSPNGQYYHVLVRTSTNNGDLISSTASGGGYIDVYIDNSSDSVKAYTLCTDHAEYPTGYWLYVLFHKGLGGIGLDELWFTRSLDYGSSWETPAGLQFSGSMFGDLAYGSNSYLYQSRIWHQSSGSKAIRGRVSTDFGATWGSSFTIQDDTLWKQGPQVTAAHDGSGDLWVVWPRRWSGTPYDYDLWWSWSQDQGATWSSPGFLASYYAQEVLPSIIIYDSTDSYYPYISYISADTTWENPIVYSTNWTTDSTWADRSTFNDFTPELVRPSQTFEQPGIPAMAYVGSAGANVYFDSWSNVGVEEGTVVTSPKALLSPNHPNPFVSVTRFAYSIPENSMVDIRVFNAIGQEIVALVHEQKSAGTYNVTWNAVDENGAALPKGIYFLKLAVGNLNATRKLILD